MIRAAAARIGRQGRERSSSSSLSGTVSMPKHLPGTHLEGPVTEREHVREAKGGEEIDIGGPGPDPLDTEKGVPRLGEWHDGQGIQIEIAAGHGAAQLEEVGGLLPCDSDAAKRRLGRRCDGLGCDRPQQPVQTPVHGRS